MRAGQIVFTGWAVVGVIVTGCARARWAPRPDAALAARADAERCVAWFGTSGECVGWRWEVLKLGRGTHSSAIFKIGRPNAADQTLVVTDSPDAKQTVDVILTMPEMGHGTGPIDVERLDVGTYRAHGIYLDHGGLYLLRVRRQSGGRPRDEASWRFTL